MAEKEKMTAALWEFPDEFDDGKNPFFFDLDDESVPEPRLSIGGERGWRRTESSSG